MFLQLKSEYIQGNQTYKAPFWAFFNRIAQKPVAYRLETLKILIAEDNKPMLDLMKSILKTFGVGTIITTMDGEEAFERYLSDNPDLIITDWIMQPCDGITLIKKVRNDRMGPNPFIPILLTTGFGERHRIVNARDAGATEILLKPFNVRDLYKRMQEIIEKPRKFVRSEDFFGPDRRRKASTEYMGPQRRKSDRQGTGNRSASPLNIDDISFE